MAQTLAIGSDHAGYDVKELLKKALSETGWTVDDKGTFSTESTDYPDYAHEVGKAVETGAARLGILVCGSGNGVCITANKHHGVRAALAWTPEIAELARQHNDANVVCIPARFVSEADAQAIADTFLKTAFEGGRHSRRVEKIEVN
ncbi:MAG: ribose 5-phosphate isomerase B [Sphingobacteriales bacterium]|nr:MAG: ribose 5-phosphate isomerase B [Sphingobacteriales bacterium]